MDPKQCKTDCNKARDDCYYTYDLIPGTKYPGNKAAEGCNKAQSKCMQDCPDECPPCTCPGPGPIPPSPPNPENSSWPILHGAFDGIGMVLLVVLLIKTLLEWRRHGPPGERRVWQAYGGARARAPVERLQEARHPLLLPSQPANAGPAIDAIPLSASEDLISGL